MFSVIKGNVEKLQQSTHMFFFQWCPSKWLVKHYKKDHPVCLLISKTCTKTRLMKWKPTQNSRVLYGQEGVLNRYLKCDIGDSWSLDFGKPVEGASFVAWYLPQIYRYIPQLGVELRIRPLTVMLGKYLHLYWTANNRDVWQVSTTLGAFTMPWTI